MNYNNYIDYSKKLSYLLRHGIIDNKLSIDTAGYVKVADILKLRILRDLTLDELIFIVKNDKKQRFDLKCDSNIWHIRANQGHSKNVADMLLDDEVLIKLETPLDQCIHGTYMEHYDSIMKQGLKAMSRKHIHFTSSLDSKSGIRYNCDMLIYIDMAKAMQDGIIFYKSKNGVILTEGKDGILESKYFTAVMPYTKGQKQL